MWAMLTFAEQARAAVCWRFAKSAALALQAGLLRTVVA